MDASSELVHSVLPVFLVTVLGASVAAVGLLEGVAEATAAMTKVFSGALSDRWQRRKSLVVAGYGLAALSKPLFPLADSRRPGCSTARFLDRVGKGIRGAPRDALIADLVPAGPAQRRLRPAPVAGLRRARSWVRCSRSACCCCGRTTCGPCSGSRSCRPSSRSPLLRVRRRASVGQRRPVAPARALALTGLRSLGRRYWIVRRPGLGHHAGALQRGVPRAARPAARARRWPGCRP